MTEIRPLAEQVWQLLAAIPAVNAFDGVVDLPEYAATVPATHRFWDLDTEGVPVGVHPYLAFYPSPGRRDQRMVASGPSNLAWSFQVTCVGRDRTSCLWCVDKVTAALTGHYLPVAGRRKSGRINEVDDPGPVRIDDDVTPVRYFVPLDFGVYL